MGSSWTKLVVNDESTWPYDTQRVTYFLEGIGEWDGVFTMDETRDGKPVGIFSGEGGFIDWWDVSWKPRKT